MHTTQSLTTLLQSRHESDLPDQILNALKPFDGKLITTRLLDALPGGRDAWRVKRNYGWTELESLDYIQTQGCTGLRLILARSERSVPLDLAFVEEDNPAYFSGRRERNFKRRVALASAPELQQMASLLNHIEALHETLRIAVKDFDVMTEPSALFGPERYELQRACGLSDPKR